jgi:hypothetical protein
MSYFTRALAAVGATVIGIGDQPPHALPEAARGVLAHYEHVSLTDEGAVLAALRGLSRHVRIDQVECLWEPYMLLAARIREELGLAGMTVEQTLPFRDKEHMKRILDAAGIRTPWHTRATSVSAVWEAAERIGYPLIVKPIAGAGAADTYRVDSATELGDVLPALRHVPEVSVEEFVDAEGTDLRHRVRGRPGPVRARAVVPPPPAPDAHARMGQPGGDLTAGPGRGVSRRRAADGSPGARRSRLPGRVHPHGVVPQARW